ncbi:MAG: outer membrane beta-barrel protein [Ignavibacteriaceae bacterium]
MKTILLSVLAVLFITSVIYPQVEKGKFALGGSISYNRATEDNENTLGQPEITSERFIISPYFGYFTSNNLMLGIGLGYNSYNYEYDLPFLQNATQSEKLFSIEPFAKYYWHLSKSFSLFSKITATFGFGKTEQVYSSNNDPFPRTENKTEQDVSVIGAALTPGISYSLNDWIALEASLGILSYTKYKYELDTAGSVNDELNEERLNFNFTLSSISLGLQLSL